jgi:adenylosuccinate synthase
VTADGKDHIFSQFGSGTLAGAGTYLSEFMSIDPLSMLNEAAHLEELGIVKPFDLLTIHNDVTVITPQHVALNRLRELARGSGRFGTTGMGVTTAVMDRREYGTDRVLTGKDLSDPVAVRERLAFIKTQHEQEVCHLIGRFGLSKDQMYLVDLFDGNVGEKEFLNACFLVNMQTEFIDNQIEHSLLSQDGTVIFEGAQGALLDQYCGYNPFTTRSNTGLENAELILERMNYSGEITSIGVTRAFATRHGPGPFPTYDEQLSKDLPDSHNVTGQWQGKFRVGWLDLVGMRHALDTVAPVDQVVVTCMDRIASMESVNIACGYHTGNYFYRANTGAAGLPMHSALGDRKTRLTTIVEQAIPMYRRASPETVPSIITEIFHVPVVATAWGPTSEDWKWNAN